MDISVIAYIIPSTSVSIDGISYSDAPVDVRRLRGEHSVDGMFIFTQMTPEDYEWVHRQEQGEAVSSSIAAAEDALMSDLIERGVIS